MTKQELLDKANDLPLAPGVYLMMDKSGEVIYVGKAKKLKNRVSQYFQEGSSHNEKTRAMVAQVDRFGPAGQAIDDTGGSDQHVAKPRRALNKARSLRRVRGGWRADATNGPSSGISGQHSGCGNGVFPPVLWAFRAAVGAAARGPVATGQPRTQVPFWYCRPMVRRRRRLSAATRWWSQLLFFSTPR